MGLALILLRFLVVLLYIALIARVLLSWGPRFQGRFGRLVFQTTEPFLEPIRSVLPRTGTLDLSPIVAFLLLSVIAAAVGLR